MNEVGKEGPMRAYLYIYVALTMVIAPMFGQDTPNEKARAQATIPAQKSPPAAQYSPLAAQAGYWREQKSPWQTIIDYLNPRHLNLGQIWEERRQAWLDNVATNEYFWYAYCVTGLLIVSWIVLWWVHDDKLRALAELGENAADALRYSEYCKREAKEAIRRHNEHLEKCNRIIEDNRSGLMTTPETAQLDSYKRELQELRNDKASLKLENAGLKDQLEARRSEFQALSERVAGVEQRVQSDRGSAPKSTNAELVERIRRLEEENRRLQQSRRVGQKATVGQPQAPGNGQC